MTPFSVQTSVMICVNGTIPFCVYNLPQVTLTQFREISPKMLAEERRRIIQGPKRSRW